MSKSSPIKFRYAFDGLEAQMSDATGLECLDPTLTQQQFKDDCNLNVIMDRLLAGKDVEHFRNVAGEFGDFTSIPDYQSSLNIVIAGQASFAALPANIRNRFSNDPAKFLEFFNDPSNYTEAVKLGLIVPKDLTPPVDDKRLSEGGVPPQVSNPPSDANES